jgi:hypothetical protein
MMSRQINDTSDWSFTEAVQDRGSARGRCALCDRRNLRFMFQVRNRHSGDQMWVGSSCILKFGLTVLQNGAALPPKEAKAKLRRITRRLSP